MIMNSWRDDLVNNSYNKNNIRNICISDFDTNNIKCQCFCNRKLANDNTKIVMLFTSKAIRARYVEFFAHFKYHQIKQYNIISCHQ